MAKLCHKVAASLAYVIDIHLCNAIIQAYIGLFAMAMGVLELTMAYLIFSPPIPPSSHYQLLTWQNQHISLGISGCGVTCSCSIPYID